MAAQDDLLDEVVQMADALRKRGFTHDTLLVGAMLVSMVRLEAAMATSGKKPKKDDDDD